MDPTVYRYDGSFDGLLCCLAECFHDKALPLAVRPLDEPQETLFPVKTVATDLALAARVARSIQERISPEAYDRIRRGFLTCAEEKELLLIRFALLGYRHGAKVVGLATQKDVYALDRALLYLENEAHFQIELLRFSDLGGFLAAEIAPKNNVLPLIAPHFRERFNGEDLMIYDRPHKLGFLSKRSGRWEFFQADDIALPPPGQDEERFRALWKRFYDTVAVEGRINPKLRQTHMPKRYWDHLTELL